MLRDPSRGVYKRVVLRDDRIVGAVLYGDTADGAWYFDLLKKGADIARDARHADLRSGLSGRRRASIRWRRSRRCRTMRKSAAATASARARSSQAIAAQRLTTLDDVRARTKASASCGPCTVEGRSAAGATLGGDYAAAARKPMCKCTDLDPRRSARTHPGEGTEVDPRGDAGARLDDARAAARPAGPRSTTICSAPGPANIATTRSRASSTSACTPTSRRTAPTRWCRACGAA